MKDTEKLTKDKVKEVIAELLGIETEDIENDFSLREDLHMKAMEISELIQKLQDLGVDTEIIDFSEIETVEDLFEALSISEE